VIVGEPGKGQITLPSLPADLAAADLPPSGIGHRIELGGLDNVNGWDDLVSRYKAAKGNFEAVLFNAAEFTGAERSLAVIAVLKQGNGSGRVTSSPAGINCGNACVVVFGSSDPVTLTAVADPGSRFAGFQGSCETTGPNTCVLGLEHDDTVRLVFAAFERFYRLKGPFRPTSLRR
jgi:hypothetical protein